MANSPEGVHFDGDHQYRYAAKMGRLGVNCQQMYCLCKIPHEIILDQYTVSIY